MYSENLSRHNEVCSAGVGPSARLSSPAAFEVFEDILNSGADLRVRVTGRSMAPFLEGEEVVTIRKVEPSGLRRGDLIFFRNPHGGHVLHRIITKRRGAGGLFFLTKGDALRSCDCPVADGEVLGKVWLVEKEGPAAVQRRIHMDSFVRRRMNYLLGLIHLARAGTYRVFAAIGRFGGTL